MKKITVAFILEGGVGGGFFKLAENNTRWTDLKEIKSWFSTANSYKNN